MIEIIPNLFLDDSEIQFTFIRAPGPGGQNVNKVATAVMLRFNVIASGGLPEDLKQRLIKYLGNKLTSTGDFIIKATRHRTQERNKQEALKRLAACIAWVAVPPKKRKKTRPTLASRELRLTTKKRHSKNKSLRRKPSSNHD